MRRGRRAVFTVILVLIVAAGVELAAFVLLRQLAGEDPAERLQMAAEAELGTSLLGGARAQLGGRGSLVIHPYVGQVVAPGPEGDDGASPAASGALDLRDFGFPFGGPLVREPRPDAVVMGVFGGSAAAYFAEAGAPQRLFAHLQSLERFRGKELVVLCTAQGGLKQPQSLMTLSYLLSLGARLDVLILLDGFNEVTLPFAENQARGVFPFFPAGWAFRLPDAGLGGARRALLQDVTYLERRRAERAGRLLGSPLRHSRAALTGWLIADRRAASHIVDRKLALLEVRDDELGYEARGPRWPAGDREALMRDLVATWRESSRQMAALARTYDFSFYHFLQPNQYVVGSKPMGSEERAAARSPGHPYGRFVPLGYSMLREAGAELQQAGVSFHDLTMAFAEVTEPLYIDDCCHVNPHGNEILADAMADAILAEETDLADAA